MKPEMEKLLADLLASDEDDSVGLTLLMFYLQRGVL